MVKRNQIIRFLAVKNVQNSLSFIFLSVCWNLSTMMLQRVRLDVGVIVNSAAYSEVPILVRENWLFYETVAL